MTTHRTLTRLIGATLALASSASALARGGDEFDNGGGAAQRLVLAAHAQLELPIRLCLRADNCRLTVAEKAILQRIYDGLPREYETQAQIGFLSERKNPGTFICQL